MERGCDVEGDGGGRWWGGVKREWMGEKWW